MNEIRKEEFWVDKNGVVSINEEIEFTLDTYLDMLAAVSENDEIYRNLTADQRKKIDEAYWESAAAEFTKIEDIWEERDWFEEFIEDTEKRNLS